LWICVMLHFACVCVCHDGEMSACSDLMPDARQSVHCLHVRWCVCVRVRVSVPVVVRCTRFGSDWWSEYHGPLSSPNSRW
jgi:hypothetical protein